MHGLKDVVLADVDELLHCLRILPPKEEDQAFPVLTQRLNGRSRELLPAFLVV